MASALYPKAKQKFLAGTLALAGTLKVVLIDTADYVYDAADEFLSDVDAPSRVATSPALTSLTLNSPTPGVFDAADTTLTAVTGDTVEALIIYKELGGAESADPLIIYLDNFTVNGGSPPLLPNGGSVTITWDSGANRIFSL
jgi:hypothetical protein